MLEGDNSEKRMLSKSLLQQSKPYSLTSSVSPVLLLCGPPGLGKTTLAHGAARHCGYHVVEINASDDRSTSTIETKILDAVQMNFVMADSKPKCLVIDEIDGALGNGKGAIDVILKMPVFEIIHKGNIKDNKRRVSELNVQRVLSELNVLHLTE